MKTLAVAFATLFACSAAQEPCPGSSPATDTILLTFEENGCNLPLADPAALGCSVQLDDWSRSSDCTHMARFACANELEMTIIYEPDWQSGRVIYRDRARTCESVASFTVP